MTNDGADQQQFDDFPEENELRSQDLENVAIVYDQIRGLRRKAEHNIDKKLAEEFDQHLKNIMYDLSVSLQEIQDDQREDKEVLKKKIILQTKKSLIGMCFNKIIEHLARTDKEAYEIFKQLHRLDDRLFDSSMNVIDSMSVLLDEFR